MAGEKNTSAPVGGTRTAAVAKTSTAFKVTMKAVEKWLAKPARELSLDEAAHCVAALHAEGHVQLCASTPPFAPVQPTFAEDGSTLVFPGANLKDTQGRFTVGIKPFISFPVPDAPRRVIKLVYGPERRFANEDDKKKNKPILIPGTTKALMYHEHVLPHLDVRTVVVLYHLANELFRWVGIGINVTAIVHAGFSAQNVVRATKTIKNKDGSTTEVQTFRDSHKYGRAIDFNGLRHDVEGVEKDLLVGRDWGAVTPPGNPARRARTGETVGTTDLWPTLARTTDFNWTRLEWRDNPKLDANKEAIAGLATFTKSFFRLQPFVDDAKQQERRTAARAWQKIYDVFTRNCTVNDLKPYEDDPASIGMGTSDSSPAVQSNGAAMGSVLHPDHASPEMRHNHYSHILSLIHI